MPKFSNQLLDDSNVGLFLGVSGDIKQHIDFGKIWGKLRIFSTNKSESIIFQTTGLKDNRLVGVVG